MRLQIETDKWDSTVPGPATYQKVNFEKMAHLKSSPDNILRFKI